MSISFSNVNVTARAASNISIATSNATFVTSNVAFGTSNVAYSTSNVAFATSNVAFVTSNVAYAASNAAIFGSNMGIYTSNAAFPAMNLAGATSNVAFPTSNVAFGTSNFSYRLLTSACNMTLGAVTAVNMEVGSGGLGYIDLKNNAAADFHARLMVDSASNLSMFTTSGPGALLMGASNNPNNIIVAPGGRVGIGAGISNGSLTHLGTTASNALISNPQALNVNGCMRTGTIFFSSAGGGSNTTSSNYILGTTPYTANLIFTDGTSGIFSDYGDLIIRWGLSNWRFNFGKDGRIWNSANLNCFTGPLAVNQADGELPTFPLQVQGTTVLNGNLTIGRMGNLAPTNGMDVLGNAIFQGRVGIQRAVDSASALLDVGQNPAGISIGCTGMITCNQLQTSWFSSIFALTAPERTTWPFVVGNYQGNSIYTYGQIQAPVFTNNSDSRIKNEIQPINDAAALDVLRQLEPSTYKYVDNVARGEETVYGFIAQQVKQVLPYAVKTDTGVIPNIYAMATVSQGGSKLTFDVACTDKIDLTSAPDGIIELTAYKISSNNLDDRIFANEVMVTVDEILDGFSVQLKEPITLPDGSTRVFVLGQKVNNFHSLDKMAIFSVGIAAVQEVDRQVIEIDRQLQATRATVADQQATISTLQDAVANLQATLEDTVANLANLVQRLAAAGIA
jgi:uncharacterized coiled-coil protein SlyX